MTFHFVQTVSLTAGAASIALDPNGVSSRCLAEADAWEWYRVLDLKFRTFASTTPAYVGFVEGKPDTFPNTGTTIMELLDSVAHNAGSETCWSRWVKVPKRALAGPLPWYKTIQGLATDEEELVGFLAMAGTGTNVVLVEYYITMEFKGPIATANTPAMLALRAKEREERRVLRALRAREQLLSPTTGMQRNPTVLPPVGSSQVRP